MFFLILFILAAISSYFYYTRNFDYWKKRGIKYEKPIPLFGTNKKVYMSQKSRTQFIEEIYWKYPDERVVGGFRSSVPELVIRDPELIKKVLVADFPSFYLRGVNTHRTVFEPLRKHLFSVEGDLWRMIRQRLTPAFTTGKLKAMFPLIVEKAEILKEQLQEAALHNRSIDARNLMACYTTDVIGTCGFGIDSDSLSDSKSAFRKIGAKMFSLTLRDAMGVVLKEVFPELCKNISSFTRVEDDFFDMVRQIQNGRNYKPIGRNDFIDLLLEYQKKGPMEAESIEKRNSDGTPIRVSAELDDKLFAAQVFVFFAAGFETSSSATSYTLHELAYNPEVQKKVHEDIDKTLARYDNALSYDSIKEMTYLEWTFKEALRMFPSLGFLMRRCSKKYKFTDIDLSIDEDTGIMIPLQALQNDPKYWDKPEEFRPERFHPDNFTEIQKSVYFPFGDGPRNCIGLRLGIMQSIAGLAAILSKFTVEPAPESVYRLKVDPTSHIIQGIKGSLPLMFRERNRTPAA